MFDLMPFERRPRNLSRYFDSLEKDLFGEFDHAFAECKTDILDKGDHYLLQAELPGFDKGDIHIDVDGDYLSISAEHKEEKNEEDKKGNFVRRERRCGSFSRSFNVVNVKTDEISAEYKNGVLELIMPKRDGTVPTSRQIDIK